MCNRFPSHQLIQKGAKPATISFSPINLARSPNDPITVLDATIMEVQSKEMGRSALRIRVDKASRKDGHEFPLEATVVAVASPSIVIERRDFPIVIDDRFPRIPEDDERQPGERKLSEDQPRTSPIDSVPNLPTQRKEACSKQVKKLTGNPCVDLMEARESSASGQSHSNLRTRTCPLNPCSIPTKTSDWLQGPCWSCK